MHRARSEARSRARRRPFSPDRCRCPRCTTPVGRAGGRRPQNHFMPEMSSRASLSPARPSSLRANSITPGSVDLGDSAHPPSDHRDRSFRVTSAGPSRRTDVPVTPPPSVALPGTSSPPSLATSARPMPRAICLPSVVRAACRSLRCEVAFRATVHRAPFRPSRCRACLDGVSPVATIPGPRGASTTRIPPPRGRARATKRRWSTSRRAKPRPRRT